MEMKQVTAVIPVYNDIVSINRTIEQLEKLKNQEVTRILIESDPGIELPASNFTQSQLLSIIDLILGCKKSKLATLKKQLQSI